MRTNKRIATRFLPTLTRIIKKRKKRRRKKKKTILASKKLRHLQPTNKIISSTNTLPTLFLNSPSNRIKLAFKRSRTEINSTIDLSAQIIQVGGSTIHPTTFCRSPPTRCTDINQSLIHHRRATNEKQPKGRKKEKRKETGRKERKIQKRFVLLEKPRAPTRVYRSTTSMFAVLQPSLEDDPVHSRRFSRIDGGKPGRQPVGAILSSDLETNGIDSFSLSQQGVLRPRYAAI